MPYKKDNTRQKTKRQENQKEKNAKNQLDPENPINHRYQQMFILKLDLFLLHPVTVPVRLIDLWRLGGLRIPSSWPARPAAWPWTASPAR